MKVFSKSHLVRSMGILLLVSPLFSCGNKKALSDDFDVILNSRNPLVRTSDRTLPNGGEIKANWFDVSFSVINRTGKAISVEEVLFYVTTDGIEGAPFSIDLGAFSYTTEDGISVIYMDYCTYPPDETKIPFAICVAGTSDPKATAPYAAPVVMMIDGLKKQSDPNNMVYPVRMVLKGIIRDSEGRDIDRFEKTVSFSTR